MSTSKPISDPVGLKKPSKDYPWWIENIDHKITPEIRHVLETYSKIRPQDVSPHVYSIREKAWKIRPYPCTGIGAFLVPNISRLPAYANILSRLRSGGKLLDVGCYLGHDLRRLVFDGAPPENLYATDIVNHWDLGFEFFKDDKDRFKASYIESDLLYPSEQLSRLHGQIDVVCIVHVLHQWDWDTQILGCKELVKFSKPGTLVVGLQGGTSNIEQRTKHNKENNQNEFTLHDEKTFQKMWGIVGEQTGAQWETQVAIMPWNGLDYRQDEVSYLGPDFALLRFLITRIS